MQKPAGFRPGRRRTAGALAALALAALPAAAAAQPPRDSGGFYFEIFGTPGWNVLSASAEDSLSLDKTAAPSATVIGSRLSSDFAYGGGVGLGWGSWGIEAAYRRTDTRDLTPSHLLIDTGAYAAQGAAFGPVGGVAELPRSRADLYFGQVVYRLPLARGARLSIGVGAGYLRVTDSYTNGLLGRDWEQVALPAAAGNGVSFDQVTFLADRDGLAYGGSVAVSVQAGPIFLRPRLDVVLTAEPLTTAFEFDYPGPAPPGSSATVTGALGTSIRPVFLLASLEIGLRRN